jgi:Phytanoyl-CoA dioxygenase (PhyH)
MQTAQPPAEQPSVRPSEASHLFVDSTPLLGNPPALRERAQVDGYLFFKQLLPAEDLLRLHADMLDIVARYGWLKPSADGQDRIDLDALNQVPVEQMRTDIGVSLAAYEDVQRLESLHQLPHHPRLLALYRTLFNQEMDWELGQEIARDVLVHPRHIARMITGHHAMVPTPPHQDFPLVQGTDSTWTCWFPLADCPRSLGSLTVLRGSHRAGCLPIQRAQGAGSIAAQLCSGENDWVEGDFTAGDVLTFPSLTVHKALPCQDKDYLRLSLDVRYQPLSEPVEARSLQPHCGLSWEEIYADWQQDMLKYYWHKLPLHMAPWDAALLQPGRRIC